MRVLVIEDDGELAEAIGVGLRQEQMAVDVVFDGATGLERALVTDYDVIVLDRDLPGRHGDEVYAELVQAGCRSRVLMLTAAAAAIEDRQSRGPGMRAGRRRMGPCPWSRSWSTGRCSAICGGSCGAAGGRRMIAAGTRGSCRPARPRTAWR